MLLVFLRHIISHLLVLVCLELFGYCASQKERERERRKLCAVSVVTARHLRYLEQFLELEAIIASSMVRRRGESQNLCPPFSILHPKMIIPGEMMLKSCYSFVCFHIIAAMHFSTKQTATLWWIDLRRIASTTS